MGGHFPASEDLTSVQNSPTARLCPDGLLLGQSEAAAIVGLSLDALVLVAGNVPVILQIRRVSPEHSG